MSENLHHSSNPVVSALRGRQLILGSKSPRRIELIKQLGIPCVIRPANITETYSQSLEGEDVPVFLSLQKSIALQPSLGSEDVLITADTVVICDREIIGKPTSLKEAALFLEKLSGRTHHVISGYTIANRDKTLSNKAVSAVTFRHLSKEIIDYYINHYEVLDKAGAYGVQDWIGIYGVEKIEGSYHNVMGLPTSSLIRDLLDFLSKN